ncbi:CopG family transcriptional regulator [Salinicola sp. CR57]|uniref:ribbon-helix-helix domain-containing protein n=1 Tax=Salinicola sp. CR57 TaxID=1949086 RepID=UPI000DA13E85|nr:CopG family transcriptional regulator [Salinicola sp. CR57]
MLTLRLPSELEDTLAFFASSRGFSKNAVIADALREYIERHYEDEKPLETAVLDHRIEEVKKLIDADRDQYRDAAEISDWIERRVIWTARDNPSGAPDHGRIYGRNIVTGFNYDKDSDCKYHLIVDHLSPNGRRGFERHHRYIFTLDEWRKNMQVIHKQP